MKVKCYDVCGFFSMLITKVLYLTISFLSFLSTTDHQFLQLVFLCARCQSYMQNNTGA